MASKASSVARGLVDGTYTDPSTIDKSTISFKFSSKKIPKTTPPVTRYEWKIVSRTKNADGTYEERPFTFCLIEPVSVSGFSIKSKDENLLARIEADPTLADKIEKGEKLTEKDSDDVGITVAGFLDPEHNRTHKALIDFDEELVRRLREYIAENPDPALKLKPKEIDIQGIVRKSRTTGRYYLSLRLSAQRRDTEKGKTYSATGFYRNGMLTPLPWSQLVRSQFTGHFFFKLSDYGMTQKTATPTLYASSCRKVDNIVPLISASERAELRRMHMLGETPAPSIAPIGKMTFERLSDDAESKDTPRESVEPTGEIVDLKE